MKIEFAVEDVLLEYVEKLLDSNEVPKLKASRFFEKFPATIEFSEDFLPKWRSLVEPVVKKFIADTFLLRQFMFESDGHIKRFSVVDTRFWENIDLTFSHRGALRIYEHMLGSKTNEQPLFLVTLPADALFVSIAMADFSEYSYPWMAKNNANWVIPALFIAREPVHADKVPWKVCFDSPEDVCLPVRDYLLERSTAYLSCVNHLIRSANQKINPVEADFKKLLKQGDCDGVPLNFIGTARVADVAKEARLLIKSIHSAMNFWTGEGMVALDDDRYLSGAFRSSGLFDEIIEFENVLKEYQETSNLEETINESVIFN